MKTSQAVVSFVILLFISTFQTVASDKDSQTKPNSNDVKFGMFVTNLHDINFAKNEFQVEFWSWFISDQEGYAPKDRTEIVNSKKFSIRNSSSQPIDDIVLHSQVFKGTIKQSWNIEKFPFDTQTLTISLEDTIDTTDTLNFVIDENSGVANEVIPKGWELNNFGLKVTNTDYPTTFGDPRVTADNSYKFSRVTAEIELQRSGIRIFISAFLGLFVATILVIITFAINSTKVGLTTIPQQPRITLCVGALFAAVGSTYSLSAQVPYTTVFTLSDSLQITTFIAIALAIVSSVLSDTLLKQGKEQVQKQVMYSIWVLFIVSHFGINAYLISGAV